MADNITYSVKVSDETQEKLKRLVEESGISNKEFFVNMLSMYEINQTKVNTPILATDIDELEQLTRRINNIFVNVGERFNNLQKNNENELRQAQQSNNNTIILLHQQIEVLKEEQKHNAERLKESILEKQQIEITADKLKKQVEQLENIISDKTALIDEYRNKNEILTITENESKTALNINRELQKENSELRAKITEMEKQNDKINMEWEKKLIEIERSHQNAIQQQFNNFEEKLNLFLDRPTQSIVNESKDTPIQLNNITPDKEPEKPQPKNVINTAKESQNEVDMPNDATISNENVKPTPKKTTTSRKATSKKNTKQTE